MQAIHTDDETGSGNVSVYYGASITNADVIMGDGKSLEHVGMVPDESVLPTGDDLLHGRDPVIVRAVQLTGGNLTAEDAGKFFPYIWDKK
jgi:hypothetical protein